MIQIPWFKSETVGVLAIADAEGKFIYHSLKSNFKKGQQMLGNYKTYTELQELSNYCSNSPIILLIDSKGILIRDTEAKDLSHSDLLEQLLPHAKKDEFQCQVFDNVSLEGYRVSIIRNESINNVLASMSSNGIVCRSVICGIPLNDNDLIRHGETLNSIMAEKDESMPNDKSLSALVWALYNDVHHEWKFTSPTTEEFKVHRHEYQYYRWTRKVLMIVPIVTLLILFANLFIYEQLESTYLVVQSEIQAHRSQLDSISNLEDILRQRSQVTGTTSQTGSIPAAYYADQIGGTIPPEVVLTELDIFPLVRQEETGKAISMSFDTLQIIGSTKSSNALNNWIQRMNSLEWIERISIRNYVQSNSDDAGVFEIQLTTK